MASPVDLAHEVIDISRVGLIWIRFGAQAIERVINILNGLVLAVGLRGQVIELVVKWRASRLSPHYQATRPLPVVRVGTTNRSTVGHP